MSSEHVRLVVLDFVEIHRDVGGICVRRSCLNLLNATPLRQVVDVAGNIAPVLASISSHLDQTIIAANPDRLGINWRNGDGEKGVKVLGSAQVKLNRAAA